ncbi:MAG: hypothetical protein JO339_15160 [Alphaproteobacteria bacterium]|nr:hypothetical protein [Alphaproteobacteria bacterium]
MSFSIPAIAQDAIRRARRPLASCERRAGSYRSWAATVCAAEARHAADDFWAAAQRLGLAGLFDREDGFGGHDTPFRFPHEAHACAALSWLGHLQAHESDRCGPWCGGRWEKWSPPRRQEWLRRRRYLWTGFVREVERYREARRHLDAAAVRDHRRGARLPPRRQAKAPVSRERSTERAVG